MTSNLYYDGQSGQNGNILSLPMKGLSISSSNNSNAIEPNTLNFGGNNGLNFSRLPMASVDSSFQTTMRSQASRMAGFPDLVSNQLSTNSKPFVLNNTSTGSRMTSQFSDESRRAIDRSLWSSKSESDPNFHGFRNTTTSRVLSQLREPQNLTVTNGSIESCESNGNPSEAYAAYIFSRFGVNGSSGVSVTQTGDSFNRSILGTQRANDVLLPSSNHHQMTSNSSGLDGLLSLVGPANHSLLTSSDAVRTTQPSMTDVPITGAQVSTPLSSYDLPLDTKLSQLRSSTSSTPGLSTTQYYTSAHSEKLRELQTSGVLKAAPWILVPPVPEGTAGYMRTGRVHELKSVVSNDRVFSPAYMDHELKQALHNRIQACLFTCDEATSQKLPRNLGAYTDLVPLEAINQPQTSATFGLPCVCFKAWSPRFSRQMLLRRVILPQDYDVVLTRDAYFLAKLLSEQDHSAIVGFRDVFFTNAFDDNSAVVVFEYIPCSLTVQQVHMSDPMKLTSFSSPFNVSRSVRPHSSIKNGLSDLGMLPEASVCSYLVQLSHGLRFIHQNLHRACGILDPSKILIQDGTRLRINCFGLKEVLFYNAQDTNVAAAQAADFVQLGKAILSIACGTAEAIQASQRATSFNLVQRAYRPELANLIRSLVSGQITCIDQLVRSTAPFVYTQLDRVTEQSDFLERQLFSSMECDRLFRLVCKLQSIVERNDRVNPEWSETGDRYMLKLFRDFVFHQTDQLGAPYLDLAHIVSCLNKVEAGSPDRLCLVSRDVQNIVIVSYAEIKQWLDASYACLVDRHRQSRCDVAVQQLARTPQQPAVLKPGDDAALSGVVGVDLC